VFRRSVSRNVFPSLPPNNLTRNQTLNIVTPRPQVAKKHHLTGYHVLVVRVVRVIPPHDQYDHLNLATTIIVSSMFSEHQRCSTVIVVQTPQLYASKIIKQTSMCGCPNHMPTIHVGVGLSLIFFLGWWSQDLCCDSSNKTFTLYVFP